MILDIVLPVPLDKSFDYLLPEKWDEKNPDHLIGRRVKVSLGWRQAVGVIVGVKEKSEAPADKLKPATELLDSEPLLSPEMLELGRWMSKRYACSLGETLFSMMPPGRGKAVSFKDRKASPIHYDEISFPHESDIVPTDSQNKAIQSIHEAIYDHHHKSFLLYGVAAAGKTEVYIAAIKDVMAQGKNSLILVPEIGLAIQVYEMIQKKVGEKNVLLWHSDLTLKQRLEGWWRMKRGEVHVVIGPRSATMAPLPNLGLIVVDEEHEASFKEDRKPRFHSRDVALFRGELTKSVVILGSATPSMESLHLSFEGQHTLLELHERATKSSRPHVSLIDVTKERYKGSLSISLQKSMEDRFKIKEQVILFLNKRGFFRYLRCPKCEWIARCPQCDIVLVQHKNPNEKEKKYICHYCSKIQDDPKKCPKCEHKKLFAGGFGTQRVAEEVKERFPWSNVLRWDRDSVAHRGDQTKIYETFQKGKFDTLVGTQMVAHGFNFPKVTLVGVVDADGALHLPDFRAAERTFQVITQVAGRAGRALVTGDVLIQTRNQDHYALQHAVTMDVLGFAKDELKFRKEFFYPPYRHLVDVTTTSKKPKQARSDIENLIEWSDTKDWNEQVFLLGPKETRRAKKGAVQYAGLFKVGPKFLIEFLGELRAFMAKNGNRFSINVDPE